MKEFIFGRGIKNTNHIAAWDPDADDCSNPHLVISGESGSGKSTLLRKLIKHLAENDKHVYVLDLHGDLSINEEYENSIEFKARKSKHGINPFEFDTSNFDNGGVAVNIDAIVTMIKKAFLPSMGAKQEAVLKQLVKDTYLINGINDEDESTWSNPLPSMETLLDLIDTIIEYHSGNGANITALLQSMDTKRKKLKELDYAGYYSSYIKSLSLSTITIFGEEDDGDKDKESKENFESDANCRTVEIDAINEDLGELYEAYGEAHAKRIVSTFKSILKVSSEVEFLMTRYRKYCLYGMHSDMFSTNLPDAIDPKNYESKDVIKTLETLKIYIGSISSSGIFTDTKPPIKTGLNRLDTSGLSDELKSFFVDTFINKIFKAVRSRGVYKTNGNFSRGDSVDTYIVIDEGRSILPSGKDINDDKQIINRVMNEARKFGLGLIFVSQSPSHYSSAILSAFTKIVLKTQENEIAKSMKLLGVKDRGLYRIIEQKMAALVGVGSQFEAVGLEGYKRPSGKKLNFSKNNEPAQTKETRRLIA